uniref:G_PROTEIN_RECEP_F1_2 domain-containing protein n=1 Tax=Macrostomum lignano TaxID=282301 RepID=A0A1I8I617_9PLAT
MVLLVFGSVFGTCGNILVICSVAMWKPLRIAGNAFVVNLAVSDLLITIMSNPFGIVGKCTPVVSADGKMTA